MVLRALYDGEPFDLRDFDRDDITVLRRDHEKALRRGEHILSCPHCAGQLHPTRYPRGLDILAHDPGHGHTCALARGESVRHDSLKRLIAAAAGRVKGWRADVEVPGDGVDPDTGRPPIIDVVAYREKPAPLDKPYGWEAQLSPASDASILNRQEVRALFLARCDWVTPGRPAWWRQVPWLGINDPPGTVEVVSGVVVQTAAGDYVPADPEPLSKVVADVLRPGARQLRWAEGLYRPDGHSDPAGAFYRPGLAGDVRIHPRERITVSPSISHPTIDCDRATIAPLVPLPPDRWRPIPNRPGIPQISEIARRVALSDQWRTGTPQEKTEAMTALIRLHRERTTTTEET